MKIPSFRTNIFTKWCERLHAFFEHWLVKYVVLPIFVIIPTTFALMLLTNAKLFEGLKNIIGPSLSKYVVDTHFILVVVIYIIWKLGGVFLGLLKHCSEPDSELIRDDILVILDSINIVVSAKRDRFLEEAKISYKEKWSPQRTFQAITKPEQQISLLIHAIKSVFEIILKNNVSFRIGLMTVSNEELVEWFAFAPIEHPPTTGPDTLSAPSSTIMRALKTRRMIIVPDVAKELQKKNKKERNFVKGNFREKDNGAILALPIHCPNTQKPIYVLSIFGDQSFCLDEKSHELYTWILDQFISRLLLEHQLMLMKEVAT